MRSRDTQRSRVYKADHSLDGFGRLETVEEIEAFTKKLWRAERFMPPVTLTGHPMSGTAGEGGGPVVAPIISRCPSGPGLGASSATS